MSIPNLIPHKTLYISGYIYSYYAFVFIFEFPEHISKHILQFHAFFILISHNHLIVVFYHSNYSPFIHLLTTLYTVFTTMD